MRPSGGPLAAVQAAVRRLFRTATAPACSALEATAEAVRPYTEGLRSLSERAAAAEETAKALVAMPKRTLRQLTTTEVRCPRNELLLRVVRIPSYLPGAAYDTHLVIPSSATTYKYDDQRITVSAWFLAEQDETWSVRCSCREVRLNREQLHGESPEPPGIRILIW